MKGEQRNSTGGEVVVAALRHMIQELPADAAVMTHDLEEDHVNFSIVPTRTSAASIVGRIDQSGWVYLSLGTATPVEIGPGGGSYVDRSQLDELIQLCSAVINGNFEERVWKRDRKLLRVRARIRSQGKAVTIRYRHAANWNPFRRATVERYVYAPYAEP